MGQIYYDLGILATDEVLERSASDMIGQYVGHTSDKTKKLLESALGKVLLIDEAYRLASGGYAKEAIDELVDLLTKPTFARKLIVILAGYDDDIEGLMATNPGLTGRFPEKISFQSLSPESCITLLISRLARESYLDTTTIQSLSTSTSVVAAFEKLIGVEGWANARDVQSLANLVSRDMLQDTDSTDTELFQIKEQHIMTALQSMSDDRQRRAALVVSSKDLHKVLQSQEYLISNEPPRRYGTTIANVTKSTAQEESPSSAGGTVEADAAERDEGVSDEIWTVLMADKQRAIDEAKLYTQVVFSHEEQEQQHRCSEKDDLEEEHEEDDPQIRVARLRREQERLRHEHLRRQKEEIEARQEHEKKIQQKLRTMGVCCQGFQWIKQASGYRCAGGSHFVADEALGAVA